MADLFAHLQAALSDRYALERELGRGGMATVYLARDLRHRRPVALKVLHPELAYALGADRFLREIEVAANLTHPHILPLHDSGEVDSLLYYVMPYIEGESLRDRLRRETQLSVPEAVQIAREVADALAYAHGQGVVHRDIKPENILLYSGHALVADFGIARALWQADGGRLTETGLAVGTATYMSPEQASGERQVDGRSDVYSLGCVLYEMLAGEPPYTGPTAQAVIAKRFSDPVPSVRRLRAAIPPAVDQAVARALSPVPADRFATATEFGQALVRTSDSRSETVVTPVDSRIGHRRSLMRLPMAALALAAAVAIGALVSRYAGKAGEAGSNAEKVIAVLPFENLGTADEASLTDGMADEIRGRLTGVPGITVIARGSSVGYRQTSKSLEQIARELGAEYLLTATVEWNHAGDERRSVRVSPEVVEVGNGRAPRAAWRQSFEVPAGDLFEAYADIAGRVAGALGVTLGDSARRTLGEKPTGVMTAYDAYLEGEAVSQSLALSDPATLRRAISHYRAAVRLDSDVPPSLEPALQGPVVSLLNSTPTPGLRDSARLAAERALALGPDRAEGHGAMGTYHYLVTKDNSRAEEALARARQAAPDDADLLVRSGLAEMTLGRWDTALANLRHAQRLDPRSVATASAVTFVLLFLRRHDEAMQAADRALALAPADPALLQYKAMIFLARGDLAGARSVLDSAPPETDQAALRTSFVHYFGLYWVLDTARQALVLRSRPEAFGGDTSAWAIGLAQIHRHLGNRPGARVYADTACQVVERQLKAEPSDAQRHELHGLCLAYLGRRDDAVREGQRAVAMLPIARNADLGAYLQHQLVRIYLLVGEPENALDHLEPLLQTPYYLSARWLGIDPEFKPLHDHPRFRKLLE